MRIIGLRAENVKRVKLVEITPDGNIVRITGKNGQGKTSTIDSICLAIGGDDGKKLTQTKNPIHTGAEKAEIAVDLGEYIVTRTFTAKGSYLKVETKDGAKLSNPQNLLNSFLTGLSFDPLGFMSMKSADQVETLQRIIGFDPAPLDKKRKELFEERTIANREVKTLQARYDAMPKPADDVPESEVSVNDLVLELNDASDKIKENQEKRDRLGKLRTLKADILDTIAELERELAYQKTELEAIQAEGTTLYPDVKTLVDPDVESIKNRMLNIETTNQQVRAKILRQDIEANLKSSEVYADELTAKIASIDNEKESAIKNAALPVAGLGFGEDGVTYNNLPISQASHAEKIRVSMAMGMAMNPKLRVILVKDGEKFDSDTWKMVEQMAADNDFQVWTEIMDETGKIGVYIEDGMVKVPEGVEA